MVLQAPPLNNYDGELDFESKAWATARQQFLESRRAQKKHADTEGALQDFLRQSCSEQDARKYVRDAQQEKPQYAAVLGVIMTKMDAFMKVGDLAIKSAPESVGLVWAGIRLCLHSVQSDFATFSQYNDACSDMIGILINCSVYGDMFGRQNAVKKMEEIHRQVLDRIPKIYADLLDFNYSMRKHTNTNRGIRILVGMYKDTAAKYKDKFVGLKSNEQEMRNFATVASQQLSQYYLEMNMQSEADILRKQSDILASLTVIDEAIRDANRNMAEGFRKQEENFKLLQESSRHQEEYLKDLKKHSPFEKAKRIFEQNEQKLDPSTDRQLSALNDTLNREPGTCQWIFGETEYKVWSTSTTNSMLWITADGGFGKSFLMGSIIETLQNRAKQEEHINVSYFFCKRGDQSTQRIERIKNSIIFQLYQEAKDNSGVLDEANRIVSTLDLSKGSKTTSTVAKSEAKKTATFVEAYQSLVRLLKKEVFLVVDALDEIGDHGDQPFLEDFRTIIEPSDIKVHVLFGSRPEGDLKKDLEGIPTFDVKGRNEADIRLNVTTLVGKLSGFSASERQLAIDDIVTKSGGQFRYVKPAMDFLRLPWSRPLEARLEKLQKGLTNSYTQALQLTDPNYHGLLKICLIWALLGEGQVKVTEVMDAFRCTYGGGADDEIIEDVVNDNQPLKQVEKAGNTFLDVDWITGVIAPRHETVTDYFLNNPSDDTLGLEEEPIGVCPVCKEKSHEHKEARPFVITRKDGHLEMAITILQTLSSSAFWRKHYPETYWNKYFPKFLEQLYKPKEAAAEALNGVDVKENSNGDSAGERDGVEAKDYGKDMNGVTDTAKAESESNLETEAKRVEVVDKKAPTTISNQSTQDKDAQADIIPETSEFPSITVTITNAEGTDDAVETEQRKVSDLENDEPDDVSTADSDINPDELDSDWTFQPRPVGEIRYEVAHCTYHLKKVEELWKPEERKGPQFEQLHTLMRTFFDDESHNYKKWIQIQTRIPTSNFYWDDGEGLTALTVASACGLTDLMRLLIGDEGRKPDGAEINKALYYAAFGDTDLVVPFQILLDNGADPKDMSRTVSAFHMLLLQSPSIEVVKLFLDHGADAKQATGWLWTPLNYLAIAGSDTDIEVLELLIKEYCADPNSRDDEGETPLHSLVRRRDCPQGFLRKFIELGADVNADDKEEQRPLYEVCMEGNVEAARIILESHPDIEKADKRGVTALLAAAANGHPKTCQLLLDYGANITALDKRSRSCFFLACGSGNPETALFVASKLEGENEKLLFLRSDAGKTPLTKAAAKGHTEVVKLLLSKTDPAVVNEKDNKLGHTPLHVAAMNGSKDIVELLLENGASTTVTDTKGHTPFKHCCKAWAQSHSRDAGALLLLMDRESIESLQDYELLNTAAVKGNVSVLEKLVQSGVSVHQMDKHGWTPLQIVSQYGHIEAVNFLTEKGAVIGRKPTAWSCDAKWVKVSEDGSEVEWLSEGRNLPRQEGRCGILSNHPIPAGIKRYYYEITITEPGGKCTDPIVGLGLCNAPGKTSGWMPGWPNRTACGAPSWAYHGDDGNLFTDKKGSVGSAPGFAHYGHGDTIGCGIDFDKSEMFFTKNGKKLETAFKDVRGRLHPVVGLGQEMVVKGNWGLDLKNFPFKWEKANVTGGGWTD